MAASSISLLKPSCCKHYARFTKQAWHVAFTARLKGVGETELAQGLDAYLVHHFVRYLQIHGVLESRGDVVRLTPRFRPMASAVAGAQIGFYAEAYGPVVHSLAHLLSGSQRYGEGLERDGRALGVHCATLFAEYHTETMMRALADTRANHLLDLGCGAGQFVLDACHRDPALHATGLDISSAAIKEAKRLAAERGFGDRVMFGVADAFQPETWPEHCGDVDVLCAVGVLHEHFRHGEAAVVSILNTYADFLRDRGRVFILGEPELRYDLVKNDADLFLVHIFTAQGFPRCREDWLALFPRTRLRCRAVYTRPRGGPRFNFFVLEER